MKNLFTLLISFFSLAATAQEPTLLSLQGIGGNAVDQIATQVTETQDSGFIILIGSNSAAGTGNIDSFCAMSGNRSIFIKYNATGTIQEWSKCYSYDSGDTSLFYIYPQDDGGYVLGGEYLAAYGFFICKENALGNIVWSHGYSVGNGAILCNMIATSDGGYIMIGNVYYTDTNFTVHNSGSMNADIGIMKVDSLGNKQWSKAIGGSEDDEATKVIGISGGGYYIVGSTESSDYDCTGYHGGGDAYLARLDSAGNIIWHNDLGGSGEDGIYGWAIPDGTGGIIMTNGSNSSDGDVSNHIDDYDYWVLDVDSSNNILWNNCFGGSNTDLPYNICKATDGSLWIAGESNGKGGEVDTGYSLINYDAWIVHADSAGNFLNAKVLGSTGNNQGAMVYPLPNSSVMAGGIYSGANGSFSSLTYYGNGDAFLSVFSPWTEDVKQVQMNNNSVEIYPNPAEENVFIKIYGQLNDKFNIAISDIIGKQVYSNTFENSGQYISVRVNDWQAGMYYVQVTNEKGYSSVQKLIVR